ncbi:chorismate-binding protein [Pseudogracilibacillus auburnensis]|nr:chorismate-binding protein [Pseudogracilibacillus auburnensis]
MINETQRKPLLFSQPEELIIANHLKDVANCLEKVEQAVENGYYVAGYISYEVAHSFFDIHKKTDNHMPFIWFGVFREPSVQVFDQNGGFSVESWEIAQSKLEYNETFQHIMDAIMEGKIDQINYTVPFRANFHGDPFTYYNQLRNAQRAKYCAYLDIGDFQILSASPELFFHVKNGRITAKPMKGTIHRGKTYEEDIQNKHWLQTSKKNQQENNLITTLMSDELKRIANEASIEIVEKYSVEKYPTVYQMTSTISGDILPEVRFIDLIKALFPCGSISGVPKRESIQMITELEPVPREVYCGAIGYITPEKEAVFNVPIRTVVIDKQNGIARYGAGGAITKDSNVDEEYDEVLTKTKVLHIKNQPFQLLETFGLYDGKYVVFSEHISRLEKSANYFDFHLNLPRIKEKLMQYAHCHKDGAWKVRLLVDENGQGHTEIFRLHEIENPKVCLAKKPINKENTFLYHKTTNRSFYKEHMRDDVLDVLLWNENDEITEFTIGNVVVEIDGERFTPPIECGLLPGTFREKLLSDGTIVERKIKKADLHSCTRIWLINSVRKWVEVELVKQDRSH